MATREDRLRSNQEYIQSKVDPIVQPMLSEILLAKPVDALKFMAEWCQVRKFGRSKGGKPAESHAPGETGKHHNLQGAHEAAAKDSHKKHAAGSRPEGRDGKRDGDDDSIEYKRPDVESDEDEDEDGDEVPDLDAMLKQKQAENKVKTTNRASVSAEVYGKFNKKENFKARVIPKSVEEKKKIKEKLLMSFLFKSLEEKDLETCINAMEIKNYK